MAAKLGIAVRLPANILMEGIAVDGPPCTVAEETAVVQTNSNKND